MSASAAMNAKKPQHPGFIRYLEAPSMREVKTLAVDKVPEDLRYAEIPGGAWVPVVKVIATTEGNTRTIREYGPKDELLRSTVQRAPS